jgi:CRP-like cAMP-binding protein
MTDTTDIRAAIAGHPFMVGLPPRFVDVLVPITELVEFPMGGWIARTGAPANSFLLLVAGRAGIEIGAASRDPMVVATVHAGDVVGWSWFVEPHEWHFDVVALDHVRALAVDATALRAACAADHELGYQLGIRLARVVASRLEATRHQLLDVYGRPR